MHVLTCGSLMPTKEEAKKARKEKLDHAIDESDKFYELWGQGALKNVLTKIYKCWEERFTENDLQKIKIGINTIKQNTFQQFVEYKKNFDKTKDYTIDDIKGKDRLELVNPPTRTSGMSDEEYSHNGKEWLHQAKGVAIRVEHFRSHVIRRNPHPTTPLKGDDTHRSERSEAEQAWVLAEDVVNKLLAKQRKRENRKKKRKTTKKKGKKIVMAPPDQAKLGSRANNGQSRKLVPSRVTSSSNLKTDKKQTPTRPTSNGPARVNRRLPSFPVYPAF